MAPARTRISLHTEQPFFSNDSVELGGSDSFIRIAFRKRDVTLAAAEQALAGSKQSLDVVAIDGADKPAPREPQKETESTEGSTWQQSAISKYKTNKCRLCHYMISFLHDKGA